MEEGKVENWFEPKRLRYVNVINQMWLTLLDTNKTMPFV